MLRPVILLALALTTCNTGGSASSDQTSGDELEREAPLPELGRLGDVVPGRYLFPRRALGAGEGLAEAELVRVDAGAFVVSVDGGPHREIAREDAWPMACLAAPLEHAEGALVIRLERGAPVFVLASSRDAARVSLGLSTAQSRVVWRDAITLEGCVESGTEGSASVAAAPEGDAACVFPDQESLDGTAGLPVPSHAPVRVVEEDGEWARVEVSAPGGSVRGWMGASLVARAAPAPADWMGVALRAAACLFPGRVDPRASADYGVLPEDAGSVPAVSPAEIERVFQSGMTHIRVCYEARLNEVPDLSVDMEVLLLVDADGRVSDADITRGERADAALSRCVLERVRRLRFPPPRAGTMNVRRSFQLRPPAPQGSGE